MGLSKSLPGGIERETHPRRAIYTSANFDPDISAEAQGDGEFDVNGAWNLLRLGVRTRDYTVDAPVCTPLSGALKPVPNHGPGIYNRCAAGQGGHNVNEQKSYQVKITRTSGPAFSILHVIRWVGNDGTFDSPHVVALPLNKTVEITVKAKPAAGVHSALMEIDDPTTLTVDFEVMNSVIAANNMTAPAFQFSASSSVDRNLSTSTSSTWQLAPRRCR